MNRFAGNNQGSVKTIYGKNDATDYYNIRRVQQVMLSLSIIIYYYLLLLMLL